MTGLLPESNTLFTTLDLRQQTLMALPQRPSRGFPP
jgi:hypothetical protein